MWDSRNSSYVWVSLVLLVQSFFISTANAQFPGVPPYPTRQPTPYPYPSGQQTPQNVPVQGPVVNFPPDRKDSVALKCDELADSPLDPQRIGSGAGFEQLDVNAALPVCEQAAGHSPVRPRYQFLYARYGAAL